MDLKPIFLPSEDINKTNYYWWINVINVDTRTNVYKYIDVINDNLDDFIRYLYNRINSKVITKTDFLCISNSYIDEIKIFNSDIVR